MSLERSMYARKCIRIMLCLPCQIYYVSSAHTCVITPELAWGRKSRRWSYDNFSMRKIWNVKKPSKRLETKLFHVANTQQSSRPRINSMCTLQPMIHSQQGNFYRQLQNQPQQLPLSLHQSLLYQKISTCYAPLLSQLWTQRQSLVMQKQFERPTRSSFNLKSSQIYHTSTISFVDTYSSVLISKGAENKTISSLTHLRQSEYHASWIASLANTLFWIKALGTFCVGNCVVRVRWWFRTPTGPRIDNLRISLH